MKISVIVPMYKVEKYLTKCLDSIVNQTYKDLEIILVDDGSPDKSGEIAEEYAKMDNRIKVIHQINRGISAARNAGLLEATGDYIAFVDSDDYIALNMYEEMAKYTYENFDVIICNYYKDVEGKEIYKPISYDSDVLEGDKVLNALYVALFYNKNKGFLNPSSYGMECIFGFPWNKLFSKNFLDKFNLKFEEKLRVWEDTWFNYQVLKDAKQIKMINESFYYYRLNMKSNTVGFKFNRIELNDTFATYLVDDLKEDYYTKSESELVQSVYMMKIILIISDIKDFLVRPENKDSFWKKRSQLKNICEYKVNKQAIMHFDSRGAISKRKAYSWMLKKRMYSLLLIAGKISYIYRFSHK
jgi:glycosyltransferase involved in cell wall biosynthesis